MVAAGSVTFGGTSNLTLNGNTSLAPGTASFNVVAPQMTATFGGSLYATGASLVKDGLGTLVLAGSSTMTGPVQVNAGLLAVNSDASFGVVPGTFNAAAIVLNGGGLAVSGSGSQVQLNANRGVLLNADASISSTAATRPGADSRPIATSATPRRWRRRATSPSAPSAPARGRPPPT